jgi:hypothetical protein
VLPKLGCLVPGGEVVGRVVQKTGADDRGGSIQPQRDHTPLLPERPFPVPVGMLGHRGCGFLGCGQSIWYGLEG